MNDPANRPSASPKDGTSSEEKPSTRPPIRPDMTVRQVAADYPGCREVLRHHGEPEDRPTKFGHLEPLDHFARRQGIDLKQLLAELSQAAGVEVDRESVRAARSSPVSRLGTGCHALAGRRMRGAAAARDRLARLL
jgi:hypothetical protein